MQGIARKIVECWEPVCECECVSVRQALEKYRISNCWFDGQVNVKVDVAAMAYIGGIAGGLIQGYLTYANSLFGFVSSSATSLALSGWLVLY